LEEFQPDFIYCQLIRAAEYVKNYHSCPKTLDYMDALSMGIERRILKTPWYYRFIFKIEARRLKLYERSIFDYFEVKTIISEQDKQLILHPDKQNIQVIPNGIDSHFFESLSIQASNDLVFVGNLNYPPNIEAIDFIINELLPKNSNFRYLISGANPSQILIKKSNNYRKKNKEKVLYSYSEYRKNNKEKMKLSRIEYKKNNKEKITNYRRYYSDKRRKESDIVRLSENVRRRINHFFN
jgi:glycosyltransferase involved in cell wall biosynthesis